VVSACYAIGCGRRHPYDIWTHHDHRPKRWPAAAIAFVDEGLQKDRTIYWINDAPNIAAAAWQRVWALFMPEILSGGHPVYRTLSPGPAEHFTSYLGLYRQAGELYDELCRPAGNSEAYARPFCVAQAGDAAKAEMYGKSRCRQVGHVLVDPSLFPAESYLGDDNSPH